MPKAKRSRTNPKVEPATQKKQVRDHLSGLIKGQIEVFTEVSSSWNYLQLKIDASPRDCFSFGTGGHHRALPHKQAPPELADAALVRPCMARCHAQCAEATAMPTEYVCAAVFGVDLRDGLFCEWHPNSA